MVAILRTWVLCCVLLCWSLSVSAQDFTYALPGELHGLRETTTSNKYEGHQVIRIKNPAKSLLVAVGTQGFDVWGRSADSIDIRINPNSHHDLARIRTVSVAPIEFQVVIPNVQTLINQDRASRSQAFINPAAAEAAARAAARAARIATSKTAAKELVGEAQVPLDVSYFDDYRTYPQIVEFLATKCTQFHQACEFFGSIGQTVEGRDIVSLKIGYPGENKPQVYYEAMLHAREWASTSTAQYIIFQLLEQSENNADIKQLLTQVDIHVVPLVNVDGYLYTHSNDRLWRKNRRRNQPQPAPQSRDSHRHDVNNQEETFGVDLNRNFPFLWGTGGSSTNPSDETYRGEGPASEPEVKAVTRLFRSLPRVVAGLDIHCFSQLIMRPWGHTQDLSPHEAQYKQMAEEMGEIIKRVHGEVYGSIKSIEMYPTSGTASDYFYSETKVDTKGQPIQPVGYTFELRPNSISRGGFILPKNEILPLGQEIFEAFVHYVKRSVADPMKKMP